MNFYAVRYHYVDDVEALNQLRPTHREFLSALPQLVAAGPFVGAAPGALLLLRGGSAEEVTAAVDGDPFWLAGLITAREVTQWNPVLGVFAEQTG